MRFGVPDWDGTVEALRAANTIAIACHVNPDGDALGSLFAASIGLRKLGKTTFPTWGASPAAIPFSYQFLPGVDTTVQPGDLPEVDCLLAVDCGAADRLGSLQALIPKAKTVINIDHHPGNDDFGTFNIVVTDVSSTAELITRLLQDLGVELDKDIATCLYTGLVTDTGRFQYANSSPDTLRLAADLLALGVPATEIATEVFESSPFGYLKLVGRVLDRAVLFEDVRFVYSWLTLSDLAETGVAPDETDKLIDAVRSTRAADVAALFKEQSDGKYRVSMRSKGPSVGALARTRGGGGHELAAGFTAPDVEQTVITLREELKIQ
ncbi:MAG: bifunctional oligoribonuclease and phosphatase NrnA [Actinomycetota bacterium]|jgi:phosphoesterase RecJ-like protein|nr:bifunctional oligoribonuclease and phosphatase NrnA [Actinomycetota bacterium]